MMHPNTGRIPPTARGEIWWLNPIWTVILLALVVAGAAYLLPDSVYRYTWKTPKYFGDRAMQLCAAFVGIFAAGCYVGNLRTRPAEETDRHVWAENLPWDVLLQAFRWCFWLTLAGYAAWAGAAILRGATLSLAMGILSGDKGAASLMKDVYLVTISGVTTLTQLGLTAVVLGGLIGAVRGWRQVRWPLVILFGMAVVRALMNSERLAIVELAIPLMVVVIRLLVLDSPELMGRLGVMVRIAPVAGVAALVGLFAASEYFRSWANYYSGGDIGFWTFVTLRLTGYYVTALNNGALLIERLQPTGIPFFTMHFLWRFPGTGSFLSDLFPNLPYLSETTPPIESVLTVGANFEFNNPDGYLLPMLDFGVVGALVFWLVVGLICGFLYRSFCRKQPLGLLLYPLVFVGIVEMPRFLYWGEGRVVPALVLLGLLAYYCRKWQIRNSVTTQGAKYA